MRRLMAIAAVGEALTGLTLLVHPPLVARLLVGAEVEGAAIVMGRTAGAALIGLGVACWPGSRALGARAGMLTYSTLVAIYLAYLGVSGQATGVLLWPAVGLHVALSLLLTRAGVRVEPR